MQIAIIGQECIKELVSLASILNPALDPGLLEERFDEALQCPHYRCYGLFIDKTLCGMAGVWFSTRLYSGRQLEIDNLLILPELQSQGLGEKLINFIEVDARDFGCETLELNSYLTNDRSHKFYLNQGYKILGFHFQKKCS